MWTGYKATKSTKEFLDVCLALGMEIVEIHASGHAYREQIETTIARLHPKTLVPVHTESADTFREMYENVHIINDGEVYEF